MKKGHEGFTLVEIVIVVAIIGLLASLASLWLMRVMHNSRVKTAETELSLISSAVLQMAWDTGKWPNNTARNTEVTGTASKEEIQGSPLMQQPVANYPDWNGPYYEGAVEDPWGQPYMFVFGYREDNSNRVAVVSAGENKTGFGEDDGDNNRVFLDD